MKRVVVALVLLPFLGCRSLRSSAGERAVAPIAVAGPDAVRAELAARLAGFAGERSLLRVRATTGERSQSFRAQLQVDRDRRMLLTAYTPLGTSALRLYAEGGTVTYLNDVESTWWRGSASELAQTFPFFASLDPSTMALVLLGLAPSQPSLTYEFGAGGLRSARAGEATLGFDPEAYPPKRVSLRTAAGQLEIEHLETVVSTMQVEMPPIPKAYRCCVAPVL